MTLPSCWCRSGRVKGGYSTGSRNLYSCLIQVGRDIDECQLTCQMSNHPPKYGGLEVWPAQAHCTLAMSLLEANAHPLELGQRHIVTRCPQGLYEKPVCVKHINPADGCVRTIAPSVKPGDGILSFAMYGAEFLR